MWNFKNASIKSLEFPEGCRRDWNLKNAGNKSLELQELRMIEGLGIQECK